MGKRLAANKSVDMIIRNARVGQIMIQILEIVPEIIMSMIDVQA